MVRLSNGILILISMSTALFKLIPSLLYGTQTIGHSKKLMPISFRSQGQNVLTLARNPLLVDQILSKLQHSLSCTYGTQFKFSAIVSNNFKVGLADFDIILRIFYVVYNTYSILTEF